MGVILGDHGHGGGSFWVTMDMEGVILGDQGHGGGSFWVTMPRAERVVNYPF